MKAIILAAGRGSRMENLTEAKPKCLVEIKGQTLLDMQINAIRAAGITEIGVVTGYKRELLSNRGLVEFHNSRWAETNMVSSLACAATWLEKEPCVVSYSDIFFEPEAVSGLINCEARVAVTYDLNWKKLWESRFGDPLLDAETFKLDSDGKLIEIGNKPETVEEIEGQYMGLLRFTPEGWKEVIRIRDGLGQADRDSMHMTGTLQLVIDAGLVPISAVQYSGEWGEVDNQTDLNYYANR